MSRIRTFVAFGALLSLASCSVHRSAKINPPSGPPNVRTADLADSDEDHREPKRYAVQAENRKPSRSSEAPGDVDEDDPDHGDGPDADSPDLAATFFRMQRWQQPGDFPMERYLKAQSDSHRLPPIALGARSNTSGMSAKAVPTFGTWQPLGPGNVGGRVRSVAIDPGHPGTVYAAAASGGVWKTTDAGQTWNPISDFLPVLGVGSMAMDPTNPSTLYVGTGEAQHNAITLRGVGIFKTTDGGQTWNLLPSTGTSSFYYTNALVVSPNQPSHIYAGTTSGLFYSPDGGATWKSQVLKAGTSYNCESLAIRSDQPTDYVFAVCGTSVNGLSTFTIFRNQDVAGTGTWEAVFTNPAMADTAIALAPSAQGTVYALASSNDSKSPFISGLLGVYRSTQNGDANSWTTQVDTSDPSSVGANILSYPTCTYSPTDHHGIAWYAEAIAVDPKNPNAVFALGVDVFRSDDGGVTWGWTNMGGGGHVDEHAIAFDPGYDGQSNQTIWFGNDGGMFNTVNALAATSTGSQAFCSTKSIAVKWNNQNHGFAATQFYHGTVVPGGESYFGGTQDNGTPLGTDALGPNAWTYLYGGDGGQVAVDPIDPNVMFYEYTNLALRKTVNGGFTNYSAINGITETGSDFQFINYYAQDPGDPLKMYTGALQLWRTVDEAENWTAASAPISKASGATDTISAITVDPNNPNHLLFGTSTGGRIYNVTNALTSDKTSVFPFTSPRAGYVSRIVFDPVTSGKIYVAYRTFRSSPTTDSEIYESNDGGNSWVALGVNGTAPLPDIPVDDLLLDPDDATRLYAGTDDGLLASFDGGITWTRDTNPFADALIESLIVQHQGGNKFLYAFTHGRGVWKVNLNTTIAPLCQYALSSSALSLNADEQFGSITVNTDPSCTWTAQPGDSFVTIQSPAGGQGPGTVYFTVEYNNGSSRNDTFYVQNQPVKVTQSSTASASHSGSNDTPEIARVVNQLPYEDISNNINDTSAATDPVHSCTSSADSRTQWWTYTAAESGQVIASVTAEAYSFAGNAGTAITVYPYVSGAIGNELACGTLSQQVNAAWKSVAIQFPVAAGSTYMIELSSTNNNTAYEIFDVLLLPSVSLSPANPTIAAGGQQKFSASVLGTPDTAVRWILSPALGTLDNAGNYTAPVLIDSPTQVTITARSFANSSAVASSTATIEPPPVAFSAAGIDNAASFLSGGVSPGEMVTVFGTSLGPTTLAYLQVDPTGKFLLSNIGNTQVTFDGTPAPLIYTAAGQLSAIVPYEVAGKGATSVRVTHNGVASPAISVPVTDAAPALFTLNQGGSGQAAAQTDSLPNSSQYPAARGSVIVLYGTGEGQTTPAGQDGLLALTAPYPAPIAPVTVQIDGKPAVVQYAGTAPEDVAGILQVNAVVPADATAGDVPVVLQIGTHTSRSDVTVNVLAPDSRFGGFAYDNTGTANCVINVFKPGDTTHPITLGTVAGGKYIVFYAEQVGNDWGIQVNSSPIRIVQHVASYVGTISQPYWTITGTSDAPFPR